MSHTIAAHHHIKCAVLGGKSTLRGITHGLAQVLQRCHSSDVISRSLEGIHVQQHHVYRSTRVCKRWADIVATLLNVDDAAFNINITTSSY